MRAMDAVTPKYMNPGLISIAKLSKLVTTIKCVISSLLIYFDILYDINDNNRTVIGSVNIQNTENIPPKENIGIKVIRNENLLVKNSLRVLLKKTTDVTHEVRFKKIPNNM